MTWILLSIWTASFLWIYFIDLGFSGVSNVFVIASFHYQKSCYCVGVRTNGQIYIAFFTHRETVKRQMETKRRERVSENESEMTER